MKPVRFGMCALLVLLLPVLASADPNWTTGYPQKGANPGDIDVKGTFVVPCGFMTTGAMEIVAVPVGGGDEVVQPLVTAGPPQTGTITWQGTITGLTSSQNYRIWVFISITDGTVTKRYGPDPGASQAK